MIESEYLMRENAAPVHDNAEVEAALNRRYEAGFVTDIEMTSLPPGLSEDIVRQLSAIKQEPAWMTEWRLKAYRHWLTMPTPDWAKLKIAPIDYQAVSYYAAPKAGPKSLADVDPKLLETYEKLGVPLHERAKLAGVAVDAVFDSVSVGTTFRKELAEVGVIFCSMSEAIREHGDLVQQYLGSVVPTGDNYFAALNSAVFSDGSFVFIPKGVRCPMELSTYFRINAINTGQFERTLIICEDDAYVSYLEGCTAPMRDENQLHAAVVELVALERAQIKYSTVQNWYPGDENGVGGIYNFVTKRGDCRGADSKISWTQVETGSAITWKYPSCVLRGDRSVGEFYSVALTHHRQQADTGTKMIHIGKGTKSKIVSKGISAGAWPEQLSRPGEDREGRRGRAQLYAVRLVADRQEVRCAHLPVHGSEESHRHRRARGNHLEDLRRPAVLLPLARHRRRRCGVDDRRWLLQAGLPRAADGVRGRGQEAAGSVARRRCRLSTGYQEKPC